MADIAKEMIQSLVERIEKFKVEKRAAREDIREVYGEGNNETQT